MKLSKSQKIDIINTFKEKIVSKDEILNVICDVIQDKLESKKVFDSLRKINKIRFVFQKYYYIVSEEERGNKIIKYSNLDLIASVLNRLNVKWYLGLASANDLNKVIWQPSNNIYIINNKYSKTIKINDQKVFFSRLKSDFIMGYTKHITPSRIQLNISSNEKTYVDYEYLKKEMPIELRDKVDLDKVFEIKTKLKWK